MTDTLIAILILLLIIISVLLFNSVNKLSENYSNINVNLNPTNYNSTKCKPKNDEVQYPIAYNDYCNMENNLDTFLTPSKYNVKKVKQPALSLHTLPQLYSSQKLLAYNEYCDISQSSITNIIPYAYNEFCMSQTGSSSPLETYSNTYVSPPQTISPMPLQEQDNYRGQYLNQLIDAITLRTPPTTIVPTTTTPTVPTTTTTPTVPTTTTAPTTPNNNVTQVHNITTRPAGYGTIKGYYSTTTSTHLLDNPLTIYYEQMNINYAPDTWKSLLRFPTVLQLPNYGTWWNWTSELENINKVIDYLGSTLGKFETHFVAATEIADKLIWVKKQLVSEDTNYKLINTNLENMLLNKINNSPPDANIVLTQEEWSSCNITTNIITLHHIDVGSSQYRPFSQGTDDVNSQTLAIISRDWEIGDWGDLNPNLTLRVDECTGICLGYKTKANKKRMYMACDIGIGHYGAMNENWFLNYTNNEKKQWLRQEIYAYISHEYTHVYQMQLIDSVVPARWHRDSTQLGERTPNALTSWWVECFATILPFLMGFSFNGFDMQSEIVNAINNIKTSNSLTASEFSNRMMYRDQYGYFPSATNRYYMWAYLVATYMAQLKTWKYVLVDFYYDFQRIPSNIPITISGRTMLAPDLDKLFLHNFEKTEEAFLQDIYAKVKNNTITIDYLSDVLPGGSNFGIQGLDQFNQSNLIN
jgi:hypothetical protein